MEIGNIERFFLNTLLRILLGGIILILVSDLLLYPDDHQTILIDSIVLLAGTISYLLRGKYPTLAVLILTSIVLAAMVYQCILVPMSTTNSLSIILLAGFVHSVMLKGRTLWIMQSISLIVVNAIFVFQYTNPGMIYTENRNEMATITITYSIIFFVLTFATAVLKASYDRINGNLHENVLELNQKASKIEAQNEELMQMQDMLNALNADLELMVRERTKKILAQNEVLLKYSYTNAHHLRGPVARLLGLANIYQLDSSLDSDFIINRMVEQAREIDEVVRQINVDLEEGRQQGAGASLAETKPAS